MSYTRKYRTRATLPVMMRTTADLLKRGGYSAIAKYSKKKRSVVKPIYKRRTTGKTITTRTVTDEGAGGYNQWTNKSRVINLAPRLSPINRISRNLRADEEKVVYRWNGIKQFSQNGYYWMTNQTIVGRRYLPLHALDLTSVINTNGTTSLVPQPMSVAFQQGADIFFQPNFNFLPDGATSSLDLQLERGPGGSLAVLAPHNHSLLKWVQIKMNLWGCKTRPTKFNVQLVQFNEESCVPFHGVSPTVERNGLFQAIIKPLTFNPVSTTGTQLRKFMKVLKTETFIIQPTSTTETDQDPHVRTLNWYLKLDKLIDYAVSQNTLPTPADLNDNSSYVISTGTQNSAYATATKRLFLMISSTNFDLDAESSNVNTPSFDLSARMCHIQSA